MIDAILSGFLFLICALGFLTMIGAFVIILMIALGDKK